MTTTTTTEKGLVLVQKPRNHHRRNSSSWSNKKRSVHFDGLQAEEASKKRRMNNASSIIIRLINEDKAILFQQRDTLLIKSKVCLSPSSCATASVDSPLSSDTEMQSSRFQKQQRILNHVNKVLDEQLNQWDSSIYDPESLARVSNESSLPSQADAINDGRIVATAVYGKYEGSI